MRSKYSDKDMEQKQLNNLFVAHWEKMLGKKTNDQGKDKKKRTSNKSGGADK